MNNTTSNNTVFENSYYDLDYWLPQFASTWALDSIYLFIITPLAVFGVILNIFSFIVLSKKDFHKNKIYIYFRCIALNSALMNLVESGIFVCSTYRYFEFSNTIESNIFGIYVYLPISNTCFMFGSCLDILVSLERCSIFVNKLKRLFTYPTRYVCMISLTFCILLTCPFFFIEKVGFYDAPISPNSTYRIWYWSLNSFGESLTGKIIAAVGYFFRGVCFFLVEVSVNMYSIYLFKKFFKNKASLFFSNSGNESRLEINAMASNSNMPTNNRVTLMERNATLMVIILCFFSIFMHAFYMTLTIYFYFSYDIVVNTIGAISVVITTSKNFSNFFLLLLFNSSFRNCVRKTLKNN